MEPVSTVVAIILTVVVIVILPLVLATVLRKRFHIPDLVDDSVITIEELRATLESQRLILEDQRRGIAFRDEMVNRLTKRVDGLQEELAAEKEKVAASAPTVVSVDDRAGKAAAETVLERVKRLRATHDANEHLKDLGER